MNYARKIDWDSYEEDVRKSIIEYLQGPPNYLGKTCARDDAAVIWNILFEEYLKEPLKEEKKRKVQ